MLLLSQAPATLAPKLARHGWLHSIFLWDRPVLLSRSKYLKVPLTLEGTLQAATAVTRCDCSADSTYKGAAFQFLLLLLAFQVVCLPVCCTQFPFSLPLSSSIYQEERQPPNPHSWVWNSPCMLTTHTHLILNEGPTSNARPCVLCGYETTACNQPLCEAEWVSGRESNLMPTSSSWARAAITAVTDLEGWFLPLELTMFFI